MSNRITGVINSLSGEPITFCNSEENEFDFSLMSNDTRFTFEQGDRIKLENRDFFIHGMTHNHHKIAIYSGDKEISFSTSINWKTALYIKAKSNLVDCDWEYIDEMTFYGGSLQNVFMPNSLKVDFIDDEDSSGYNIRFNDDSIEYDIQTDGLNFTVRIGSSSHNSQGITGVTITNSTVYLTVKFAEKQKLSATIQIYNRVRDLLSFLTFRRDVFFEKIEVGNYSESEKIGYSAEFCARDNISHEIKTNVMTNITFDDLKSEMGNLISLIFKPITDSNYVPLQYIPENDKNVYRMTESKVKDICSALESELKHHQEIGEAENKALEELRVFVKAAIKQYRREHKDSEISEKTYNLVNSDIKNWSLTLSDRLVLLYYKYQEEIINLNVVESDITEDHIKKFVYYRNGVTHGNHQILDSDVANTAYLLVGLIYASILDRIGVSKDRRLEIFKRKILR